MAVQTKNKNRPRSQNNIDGPSAPFPGAGRPVGGRVGRAASRRAAGPTVGGSVRALCQAPLRPPLSANDRWLRPELRNPQKDCSPVPLVLAAIDRASVIDLGMQRRSPCWMRSRQTPPAKTVKHSQTPSKLDQKPVSPCCVVFILVAHGFCSDIATHNPTTPSIRLRLPPPPYL